MKGGLSLHTERTLREEPKRDGYLHGNEETRLPPDLWGGRDLTARTSVKFTGGRIVSGSGNLPFLLPRGSHKSRDWVTDRGQLTTSSCYDCRRGTFSHTLTVRRESTLVVCDTEACIQGPTQDPTPWSFLFLVDRRRSTRLPTTTPKISSVPTPSVSFRGPSHHSS